MNNSIKKITSLLLVSFILVLSLTSCGFKSAKEKIKEASINLNNLSSLTQNLDATFNMSNDSQDMEAAMLTSIVNSTKLSLNSTTDIKNQKSSGDFTFSLNNVDYKFKMFGDTNNIIIGSPFSDKYLTFPVKSASDVENATKTNELSSNLVNVILESIDDKSINSSSSEITLANNEKIKTDQYDILLDNTQGFASFKALMDFAYTDTYLKSIMTQNIISQHTSMGETISEEDAKNLLLDSKAEFDKNFESTKENINLSGSSITINIADKQIRNFIFDIKTNTKNEKGNVDFGFKISSSIYDLNKEAVIELPALTEENTQSSEEFMSDVFSSFLGLK